VTRRVIRRAFRAALSRGYGYEPHEPGRNFVADGIRGYFIDYRPKITSYASNPAAVLSPVGLAQLALGWWERVVMGETGADDEFLFLCDAIVRCSENRGESLLWPYRAYVPKYDTPVPWYSSMAQGQIASVFVRAWGYTGEGRYADLARRAIRPMLEPGSENLVTLTSEGPVLEEVGPCTPPSHILNGWIYALWGVRDVSLALTDARADRLVGDTTACLVRMLPRYDVGWWSMYSLYPHPLPDLAKPFYHRLHVTQLEILHRLTGLAEFRRWADRWRSFDRPAATITAVASKIPFAVTTHIAQRREHAVPREFNAVAEDAAVVIPVDSSYETGDHAGDRSDLGA
jgi:heparosan-N-sulfate-glucuronate 5-epimerase